MEDSRTTTHPRLLLQLFTTLIVKRNIARITAQNQFFRYIEPRPQALADAWAESFRERNRSSRL